MTGLTAVRHAIVDALRLRAAFAGVEVHAYPAGDLAEWRSGFVLANAAADRPTETLDGQQSTTWQLDGGLWVAGSGATDDDFEDVETSALELVEDLEVWLVSVRHGRALTVTPPVDSVVLSRVEVEFTAEPACNVDFTLTVVFL